MLQLALVLWYSNEIQWELKCLVVEASLSFLAELSDDLVNLNNIAIGIKKENLLPPIDGSFAPIRIGNTFSQDVF